MFASFWWCSLFVRPCDSHSILRSRLESSLSCGSVTVGFCLRPPSSYLGVVPSRRAPDARLLHSPAELFPSSGFLRVVLARDRRCELTFGGTSVTVGPVVSVIHQAPAFRRWAMLCFWRFGSTCLREVGNSEALMSTDFDPTQGSDRSFNCRSLQWIDADNSAPPAESFHATPDSSVRPFAYQRFDRQVG